MQEILKQLGIEAVNDGTWFGSTSVSDDSAGLIESSNPATDEHIALSLIHISEPTRPPLLSRMPSSA